jgi:CubicO group peptidase (beta-lactamase class C family)
MQRWGFLVGLFACSKAGVPSEPLAPDAPEQVRADAPDEDHVIYPDPDWKTGTPESQGLDSADLARAIAAADATDSYCLLVIRHGVLVSETYFHGANATSTPSSWSIAKSYTSTTTGIAIEKGALPPLDTPIMTWVPTWAGNARSQITLRHLMTMTSGLEWSIFRDYIEMAQFAPDKSGFAVGSDPDTAAGSAWRYNNAAVQVMEPVFRAATGGTIEDYARANLWSKIGMTATWAHDGRNHPTTYANVLATCRDHARFGYLYLRGGKWKTQQVVPASWITAATTPSNPYNQGYGYLFWLNGHAPTIGSTGSVSNEPLYYYAPPDLFGAHGFGTQFIEVIPSLDMVVVRFGRDPTAMTSTDPAVIAAQLAEDQTSDARRQILTPIFDATQ